MQTCLRWDKTFRNYLFQVANLWTSIVWLFEVFTNSKHIFNYLKYLYIGSRWLSRNTLASDASGWVPLETLETQTTIHSGSVKCVATSKQWVTVADVNYQVWLCPCSVYNVWMASNLCDAIKHGPCLGSTRWSFMQHTALQTSLHINIQTSTQEYSLGLETSQDIFMKCLGLVLWHERLGLVMQRLVHIPVSTCPKCRINVEVWWLMKIT